MNVTSKLLGSVIDASGGRAKRTLVAIALGAIGLSACGIAAAGCGGYSPATPAPASWNGLARPALMPAVYVPQAGGFLRVHGEDFGADEAGLVGMWRVTLTSDGTGYPSPTPPLGAVLDFSSIQYHPDGTEIMISGARAPSTGDVCMGMWKQVGERTYKVRHLALGWVGPESIPPAPVSAFQGPTFFHESITLNRARNAFEGTFTADVYAKDEITLLVHLSGTMTGARFSVD